MFDEVLAKISNVNKKRRNEEDMKKPRIAVTVKPVPEQLVD